MGNPKKAGPAFIRNTLLSWYTAALGAATVAPDFAANTLATVLGGVGGFTVPHWFEVEKLRFIVGNTDFAGAGGTLTFELRKNSATGTAIASLTIPLATALRGAVLEASVTAALDETAKLRPTDTLFLVRLAAGTVFTTGEGTWSIVGRQVEQSKGV